MNNNTSVVVALVVAVVIIGGGYWMWAGQAQGPAGVPAITETQATTSASQYPATSGGTSSGSGAVGGTAGAGNTQDEPLPAAAAAARTDLAVKLGTPEENVVIVTVTSTTWSDACLGLAGPTETCAQTLVSGYRVEMLAEGKTYIYRTDTTGKTMRSEAVVE